MPDLNLLNYVKSARAKSVPYENIKQALVLTGWNEAAIDEAIVVVKAFEAQNYPAPATGGTQIAQSSVYIAPAKKKSLRLGHPLSGLLALVLGVSLFILCNKAVTDILDYFGPDKDNYGKSVGNGFELVMAAVLIVPFLLLSAGLYWSLHESKKKYNVLTTPYLIISGWLVVRLLFRVSAFILDKQTTYGVYIVLAMIIAVLTSIIIFIQKYVRHNN